MSFSGLDNKIINSYSSDVKDNDFSIVLETPEAMKLQDESFALPKKLKSNLNSESIMKNADLESTQKSTVRKLRPKSLSKPQDIKQKQNKLLKSK